MTAYIIIVHRKVFRLEKKEIGPRLNIKYGFNWASKKTNYGWTLVRSGFKTFNQVQGQGGSIDSTAGIYLIFRVLNPSAQHRNWA
jgi:hypothetical protein